MCDVRVRINVVGYDKEDTRDPFYPVQVSQSTDAALPQINVLLLGDDKTTHFVLIKSLNALLRKPNTHATKHHCVRYVFLFGSLVP